MKRILLATLIACTPYLTAGKDSATGNKHKKATVLKGLAFLLAKGQAIEVNDLQHVAETEELIEITLRDGYTYRYDAKTGQYIARRHLIELDYH